MVTIETKLEFCLIYCSLPIPTELPCDLFALVSFELGLCEVGVTKSDRFYVKTPIVSDSDSLVAWPNGGGRLDHRGMLVRGEIQ